MLSSVGTFVVLTFICNKQLDSFENKSLGPIIMMYSKFPVRILVALITHPCDKFWLLQIVK